MISYRNFIKENAFVLSLTGIVCNGYKCTTLNVFDTKPCFVCTEQKHKLASKVNEYKKTHNKTLYFQFKAFGKRLCFHKIKRPNTAHFTMLDKLK